MNSEADVVTIPTPPSPAPRFGETVRQAGLLFSAQTASMAINLLVSIVLLRWMDSDELGRLAFCLSVILLTNLFFELGVFAAGSRVLALARTTEEQRRALGALVLLAVGIGAALAVFIAATATPIDAIFHKDSRWLLISAAALAFFQPFQMLIELSCQGLNRIRQLAIFQLSMSGFYLIALCALAFSHNLSAKSALLANLTGTGVAALIALLQMKPRFRGATPYFKMTIREARGYGLNLYLARITGTASTRLDNFVIAYFIIQPAPLGLYDRAQKLTNPISNLSRALAVTRFRAFANVERVPARILKWNAIILVAAAFVTAVFGPFALKWAFPQFAATAWLLVPFAIYNLFAGLFQPYNTFLAARGHSASLRNIAIAVTIASIIGLLIAVPLFGIFGAAWAGAGAMLLDYLLHLYYYRRSLTHRSGESRESSGLVSLASPAKDTEGK